MNRSHLLGRLGWTKSEFRNDGVGLRVIGQSDPDLLLGFRIQLNRSDDEPARFNNPEKCTIRSEGEGAPKRWKA